MKPTLTLTQIKALGNMAFLVLLPASADVLGKWPLGLKAGLQEPQSIPVPTFSHSDPTLVFWIYTLVFTETIPLYKFFKFF